MIIFIFLSSLVVIQSFQMDFIKEKWDLFKTHHQKKYPTIEEHFRQKIFSDNLMKYKIHNKNFKAGAVSYEVGVNQFSDMTPTEIKKITQSCLPSNRKLMTNSSLIMALHHSKHLFGKETSDLPKEKNWVEEGFVSYVKTQGKCGSCWAFTVAGALESAFAIQKQIKVVSNSAQNLIDCSPKRLGTFGCDGGSLYGGFSYVHRNDGIEYEATYPYQGQQNKRCLYNPRNSAGRVKKLGRIEDEDTLKYVVAKIGPVAAAVYSKGLWSYKSGIYDPQDCNKDADHGVLVVGYGTESGKDYWLIKNSWGSGWGENGYFRMSRGKNTCRILSDAIVPLEVK